MRLIFDLGHPGHFHLFKNTIQILKDTGIAFKGNDKSFW